MPLMRLRRTFSGVDIVLLGGGIAFAIAVGLFGWGQGWLNAAMRLLLFG